MMNGPTCEMLWMCDKSDEMYACTREVSTVKKVDGEILLLCWECFEAIQYYGADVVGVVRDDDETEDDETEKAA